MKLPVSEKTSSFTRPHIRKGYYPGKLLKIEEFKEQNGTPKEGKYGRQLIFEFAVFAADPETGAPLKQIRFVDDGISTPVKLSKFVYHQYKNDKGELRTAITPKSAITKLLMAIGWEFNPNDVDTDALIGQWAELNVDDYEKTYNDETTLMSTIKDVSKYKGPDPNEDAEPKKPVAASKPKEPVAPSKPVEPKAPTPPKADGYDEKYAKLKELKDSGELSEKGFNSAIEQLGA